MKPDYLNDMAIFVAVVKANSFRQAADNTGIPLATLSRRLKALEQNSGIRLLNRTTRTMQLTEAGEHFYQQCQQIIQQAELAHDSLQQWTSCPRGRLKVSLPTQFTAYCLMPQIAQFRRQYPHIDLQLDCTPQQIDLLTQGFDLVIRIGEQANSSLIARHWRNIQCHLYANPSYLAQNPPIRQPNDLKQHQLIQLLPAREWQLHQGKQQHHLALNNQLIINDPSLAKQLALEHLGIIFVPPYIVANELTQQQLQPVLPQWHSQAIPIYFLTEHRLLPAKTRLFMDFLRQGM